MNILRICNTAAAAASTAFCIAVPTAAQAQTYLVNRVGSWNIEFFREPSAGWWSCSAKAQYENQITISVTPINSQTGAGRRLDVLFASDRWNVQADHQYSLGITIDGRYRQMTAQGLSRTTFAVHFGPGWGDVMSFAQGRQLTLDLNPSASYSFSLDQTSAALNAVDDCIVRYGGIWP